MRKKLFALLVGILAVTLLLTACAGVNLTLTFELDGEAYATVTTSGQEAVQMPKDPTKEGYLFDGWYWDKDVWEKPFTANSLLETPLSENMTVYAKWKEEAEEHVHSYGEWTVTTAATCTTEGLEKRVCECGEEETRVIAKLPHSFGEWTVVNSATCTAEGLEKRVCECGEAETRVIEKLPHSFGEWTVVTAATCTTEGLEKRVCGVCETEETRVIEKLPHNFSEWAEVTPSTCTAEGTEKRICSVCETEETRAIAKLAHTYVVKHDATNHWKECSVCREVIDNAAHSYGEWTVVNAATCTAEGLEKRVCECGEAETRVIEKLSHTYEVKHDETNHWKECAVCHEEIDKAAHSYGEWTVETAATCTLEGTEKRLCECGEVETRVIEKLSHTYEEKHDETNHWKECAVCHEVIDKAEHSYGEWTVVTAATCTTEGTDKRVCECGEAETRVIEKLSHTYEVKHDETNHWKECAVCHEEIDKAAHSYGEWTVETAATCTLEGTEKRVCECGEAETRVIEKLSHTYEEKHDETNHWKECAVCHEKNSEGLHIYENEICTVCGKKYGTEGLSFNKINGGYEVSGIGNAQGNYIEIPSTYENEAVIAIKSSAFSDSSLVSVVIPNSVTSIGSSAFYECSSLVSVVIPDSVTSIGSYAFYYCSSLVSIEIPSSVTSIGSYAFSGCSSLTKVEISDIAAWCRIKFGDNYANPLYYAKHLYINGEEVTELVIPEGVTSIGDDAFRGCSSLVSVEIPSSVTSIRHGAFWGCSSLTKVEISDIAAWCGIKFGNSDANPLYYAKHLYINGEEVTELVIPEGVKSIGDDAFYNCRSLVSVEIPSSVTSIGADAFYGTGIWNNTAENSVVYADKWAVDFKGTATQVMLRADTVGIGDNAFRDRSSLVRIEIPSSVTSIGTSAFDGCSSLVSIVIPTSVTSIDSWAFAYCSNLIIYAEASAKPSGWNSSWNYSNRPVVWDYKNNEVASDGFIYTVQNGIRYGIKDGVATVVEQPSNIKTANIPSEIVYKDNTYSVTSIGTSAFDGCSSLKSIIIPSSVTSIGTSAFRGCSSLVSIEIPSGVKSIGSSAFWNCSSLVSVVIPSSVTSIGSSAFDGCKSLISIEIPSSVKSIGSYAFSFCSSLTKVEISDIAAWCGIEFGNDYANPLYYAKHLYINGEEVTELVIPEGVTSIGTYAFSLCSSLVSVEIPSSVTSIGDDAFRGCSSLVSVEIPSGVTSIGNYAFSFCSSLKSIVYGGTKAEWKAITKGSDWNYYSGNYTVTCTDGTLSKAESK